MGSQSFHCFLLLIDLGLETIEPKEQKMVRQALVEAVLLNLKDGGCCKTVLIIKAIAKSY